MPLTVLALLALAASPPADFAHEEQEPLLAFAYSWPAAVEAEPALARHMRARMARERAQALINARAQRRAARRGGYVFERHSIVEGWQVEGRTARLMALSAVAETFTGGGHGNHEYSTLLWDRAAARAVELRAILGEAAIRRLAARFCPARIAALRDRHGGAEPEAECPRLAELAILPADGDGNGRFERLRVFIDTGYFDAEGITVDVAFEPDDLGAIPVALAPAFEAAD